MIAEFYIVEESFKVNPDQQIDVIADKLYQLAVDLTNIRNHKEENKIFVHPRIYEVEFYNGITISDLLNSPPGTYPEIDKEIITQLKTILWEAAETEYSAVEILENFAEEDDEDICFGVIAFSVIDDLPNSHQVVYGLQDWYEFRRYYVAKYPQSEEFFIDEMNKYLPNVYLHDRNKASIKPIFKTCVNKIVYHLTQLNTIFPKYKSRTGLNRSERLIQFSTEAQLDEVASLEGDASRKPNFTFLFKNDLGNDILVCCEPHMKLPYSDNDNNQYSTNRRIYFHEGNSDIENGNILVGHIGNHL